MRTRITFIFDDEQNGNYERQNILAAQDMRRAYEELCTEIRNKVKYSDMQVTSWLQVQELVRDTFAEATRGFD